MREMDAFEQAYKNGFAAGMKAAEEKIVHCYQCKYYAKSMVLCLHEDGLNVPDKMDFCSYGERRADNAAD